MKITISRGATINIGNYESSRLDMSFEEQVDGLSLEALETFTSGWDKWLVKELSKRIKSVQTEAGLPPQPVTRFTGKL